ncbi:hypothetical protein VTK56DRAFT_9511 [Thermocarpiscus australiensis]
MLPRDRQHLSQFRRAGHIHATPGGSLEWVLTSTARGANPLVNRSPGLFTCVACPANPTQRRALSRSVPRHAVPSEPSPSGIARLTSRKLLSVSGPDAAKYLQGVITANLYPGSAQPAPDHLRTDAGFYAAFLTAQGRVLHNVFVYQDIRDRANPPGHSWLVEVDTDEAKRLHKHIRRYKLRAKFDVRVLDPSEAAVWHLWSDDDPQSALLDAEPETLTITAPDPRAPGLGHRLVTFDNPSPSSTTTSPLTAATATPLPLPVLDESAYRLRRYLHGIAEGQAELLYGQALPHESNMDLTGAVDFRKGCYVGQELTIRTEHRGVVRKRILPCLLYPEEITLPPQPTKESPMQCTMQEVREYMLDVDGEKTSPYQHLVPLLKAAHLWPLALEKHF